MCDGTSLQTVFFDKKGISTLLHALTNANDRPPRSRANDPSKKTLANRMAVSAGPGAAQPEMWRDIITICFRPSVRVLTDPGGWQLPKPEQQAAQAGRGTSLTAPLLLRAHACDRAAT